jgi:hypothetical protein
MRPSQPDLASPDMETSPVKVRLSIVKKAFDAVPGVTFFEATAKVRSSSIAVSQPDPAEALKACVIQAKERAPESDQVLEIDPLLVLELMGKPLIIPAPAPNPAPPPEAVPALTTGPSTWKSPAWLPWTLRFARDVPPGLQPGWNSIVSIGIGPWRELAW